MATIGKLRTLARPARDDARIDLAEAQAAELINDSDRQRRAAQAALDKCRFAKQALLAAEAKRWLGMAYKDLGKSAKARAVLEEAKDAFGAMGDRLGAALTQHELAEMLENEGSIDEALIFYREVVRFYTQIGHQSNLASALSDIGDVLTRKGDLMGAISAYDQARAASTNVRDKSTEITALARKGDILVWEGNLSPAQDAYQQAITIARNNKLISEEADALDSLAQLRIIEGDLAGAEKICQQVDSLSAAIKTTSMDLGTWRSYYSVLVETGRFAQAESLANTGVQQSVKDQSVLHQAIAEGFLARALLAQGKSVAARDAVVRATASSEKSKDLHTGLTSAITRARISAAQGEFASPEEELADVLDQAKKAGVFDVQLDATMAVADLQRKRGEKNRARRLLTALEVDAKTHGFKLVAAQAKQKRS